MDCRFIGNDEPPANLISWNDIDLENGVIEYTTLEKAIKMACDSVGIDYDSIKSNIKYYDFEYPNANGISILIRVRNTGGGTNYTHFALPDTATLYEASYYHWIHNRNNEWQLDIESKVLLNGKQISYFHEDLDPNQWDRRIDMLSVGVGAHTVGIQMSDKGAYWNKYIHGGVGVVLIYKI